MTEQIALVIDVLGRVCYMRDNIVKFISDIQNVTKGVTYENDLTETERSVLAILKQNPESSRDEIATKISKTVRTVQRALVVLTDKGYIRRVGAKKNSTWEVNKLQNIIKRINR